MSSTDPTSPTPRLRASALLLLEYLRAHADADGCIIETRDSLAAALGIARSTLQLAVNDLTGAAVLSVEVSAGGSPNAYCLTARPTDSIVRPTDSSDRPTDPALSRASAPERGSLPPTPKEVETATLSDTPLASAPAREEVSRSVERPTEPEPTEVISLGRAAAAAVCDGAAAAGRPVEANLGQVGKAAKDLEAQGEEIVTILRAATRVGVAGTTDLRTAVEAVKEGRALPGGSGTAAVEDGARTASCIRMLLGTWPRARIDAALWEEELGRVQERFLLAAMRAIAKDGAEFPPHWGQVYRKALEVGQPIIAAERSERARRAELEREHARQAAS